MSTSNNCFAIWKIRSCLTLGSRLTYFPRYDRITCSASDKIAAWISGSNGCLLIINAISTSYMPHKQNKNKGFLNLSSICYLRQNLRDTGSKSGNPYLLIIYSFTTMLMY